MVKSLCRLINDLGQIESNLNTKLLGVGKKNNSPMHRDSLFNDSEYFRIDSELLFFPHMARVHARDTAGFIAQNLCCETRAHCLTVCASTRRVLL